MKRSPRAAPYGYFDPNAHPLDLFPVPHGYMRTGPNHVRRCQYGERCSCPLCNPGADAHSNHDPGDEDRSSCR